MPMVLELSCFFDVFNSSANLFVYLGVSASFRRSFFKHLVVGVFGVDAAALSDSFHDPASQRSGSTSRGASASKASLRSTSAGGSRKEGSSTASQRQQLQQRREGCLKPSQQRSRGEEVNGSSSGIDKGNGVCSGGSGSGGNSSIGGGGGVEGVGGGGGGNSVSVSVNVSVSYDGDGGLSVGVGKK